MPNIPQITLGNTTYNVKDKRVDVLKNSFIDTKLNLFDKNNTNDGWLYAGAPDFEKEDKPLLGMSAPVKVNYDETIIIVSKASGYPIVTLGSDDIDDPIAYTWCTPTAIENGNYYYEYIVPENTPYITIGFILSNKEEIFMYASNRDEVKQLNDAVRLLGNPEEDLFDKTAVNIGWYYTVENGLPVKRTASWGSQSAPIKVSPGDVITIYGTSQVLTDGLNIITMPDADFNNIQRIVPTRPLRLYNDYSIVQYVVPNDAEYISFSLGTSVINTTHVYRGAKLYNAKYAEVAALGDSITYGHITPSVRANPTWCDIVASNLHCDVYNHGLSGSGICDGSVTPLSDILEDMEETHLDCLIISAGTNDYGDTRAHTLGTIDDEPAQGTNFYASFKYLIQQAIIKYPMAQILVITPMRRSVSSENQYEITLEDIVNAEIEVARYYGVKCFDFYHEGGINPAIERQRTLFTVDGLHPNQIGINLFLGPRFSEAVKELISCRAYCNL